MVAAESSIGDVDGVNGVLIYQGLDIHDLAEHSTFEETVYLLWHGRLPEARRAGRAARRDLAANQHAAGEEVLELMRQLPADAEPMDALRTAVSALAFYDPGVARPLARERAPDGHEVDGAVAGRRRRVRANTQGQGANRAARATSTSPRTSSTCSRARSPAEREARIFDVCLILHADHELNASTFTARVIAGTLADMYGAVTGAIAALSGPLHGGREHERDEDAA